MAQTWETEDPPAAAAKLTVSQMWRSCPDNTAPHTGCSGRAFTESLANSHVAQTHTYMCMQMSIWTNSMVSLTHSLTHSQNCHKSTNIQEQTRKKLVPCSCAVHVFPLSRFQASYTVFVCECGSTHTHESAWRPQAPRPTYIATQLSNHSTAPYMMQLKQSPCRTEPSAFPLCCCKKLHKYYLFFTLFFWA